MRGDLMSRNFVDDRREKLTWQARRTMFRAMNTSGVKTSLPRRV